MLTIISMVNTTRLIGKTGYSLKRIMNDIENSGFHILKTYRVFEWYYHRFFILKKRK